MDSVRTAPSATIASAEWLDDREATVWRSFLNGSQRLIDVLARDLQTRHGLSFNDYRMLVLLSEEADGSLRMRDIADQLALSRSRLTHQIGRLEEAGLVRRDNCSEDGRGVYARLTPEGQARLELAAPGHVEVVRKYFVDLLGEAEMDVLAVVCQRINRELDEISTARY